MHVRPLFALNCCERWRRKRDDASPGNDDWLTAEYDGKQLAARNGEDRRPALSLSLYIYIYVIQFRRTRRTVSIANNRRPPSSSGSIAQPSAAKFFPRISQPRPCLRGNSGVYTGCHAIIYEKSCARARAIRSTLPSAPPCLCFPPSSSSLAISGSNRSRARIVGVYVRLILIGGYICLIISLSLRATFSSTYRRRDARSLIG